MTTIAIVGVGDMGSAVGAVLGARGLRVVTDLSGRSPLSRELAAKAGIEDLGSLAALVREADMILAILPPAAAAGFAGRVAAAMRAAGTAPLYADCNAVSPQTLQSIARRFEPTGAAFLDVGIVGPPPKPGRALPTRFYVSGGPRSALTDWAVPEIAVRDMGPELGRASAIKMAYASMNKATDALYTAVLMAAEELGVRAELMAEFEASQPEAAARMAGRVPYLAAAAERYIGEMREIAATYRAVGVTPKFHEGAEWLYARLAASELGSEARATLPEHRSLDEALAAFCAAARQA